MAGIYNRLVAAPGQPIALGAQGGVLLLNPPAQIAGQMTLTDMQNRVWHLLREAGPDTGFLPPQVGDWAQATLTRDLNIALAQFISATGLAPKISDRQVTVPVFAVLDYPVPPDTEAIYGIDYTPAGQQTYSLIGHSFEEFKAYWSDLSSSIGQPTDYRQMFAGYVRLFPQPGPGQALGPGIGTITFNGTPDASDTVQVIITNASTAVVVPTYTCVASDTTTSVAQNVANLIAASNACVGPAAFLQPPGVAANAIQLTAINPPGTQISYLTTITTSDNELTVVPNGLAYLQPNGDTMTFYYSSNGKVMLLPGDTPQIPPQFHMALVYRVLADYWLRKADPNGCAKTYYERFLQSVKEGKNLEWDSERSVQPTSASMDDSEFNIGPSW